MKKTNYVAFWPLLRITLGAILILSGILKFIDLESFGQAILRFKILNHSLVPYVKVLIPSIETILGVLLLKGYKTEDVSQAVTWLLAFFTALIIAKIFEGEKISCNCFGILTSGNIDWTTVLRNLVLVAAAIGITTHYSSLRLPTQKEIANTVYNRFANKKWYTHLKKNLAITLFFFLAVQSIILSLQNAGLKDNISLLLMNNETVQPGEMAQEIEATELNGNKTVISFNHGKYSLLYIFSSKCEPCKINFPNWIKLSEILKNKDIIITGIGVNSAEEINKYFKEQKPNFKILAGVGIKFKTDYKAYTTPQTIVIGKDGKIIKSYPGIMNQVSLQKLLTDLSIPLN